MAALPPPDQIELTTAAFKTWMAAAEIEIDNTMTNALDQLRDIGVSMEETKRLWFQLRHEMD